MKVQPKGNEEIVSLAFDIADLYDDFSTSKQAQVAEMIAKWHEQSRWKSAFKDLQTKAQFDLECE